MIPGVLPAYIDPGTGSFVIQALLAALVGAGVALRAHWQRVKAFFGGGAKEREVDPADEE